MIGNILDIGGSGYEVDHHHARSRDQDQGYDQSVESKSLSEN